MREAEVAKSQSRNVAEVAQASHDPKIGRAKWCITDAISAVTWFW